MKTFCPNCEKETEQRLIETTTEIKVKEENIQVQVKYYQCEECGEDYEIPSSDYDPLDEAYRIYRSRKGLLQPEEIKDFRKKLVLSQKEMSNILGIGIATLNRYENGSLQSDAHDNLIRSYMQLDNLLHLLEEKPELLPDNKREELIQFLKKDHHDAHSLVFEAIEEFGSYPPSKLSGFTAFNFDKFTQVVKFFCFKKEIVKTKLLKLLFYADFRHFKEYGVSITGSRYANASYGPVPDKYETLLASITEWTQEVTCKEKLFGTQIGEVYISDAPDYSVFSNEEIETLGIVDQKFKDFTGSSIHSFSQKEKGYRETTLGQLISYEYAKDLQI